MPTQQQIQNVILSAQYKLATYENTNLGLINMGQLPQNNALVNYLNLNLLGLQFQYERPDYVSNTTVTIYNRLLGLIGIDTTVNQLDPNFQNPAQVIQIILPASYISPLDITWDMFSTDNSPDGGTSRNTYYNSDWKGLNPFMDISQPGSVKLFLGTDYVLIPSGGFILQPGGNLPFVFEGSVISAYSYALA